MKQTDPQMKIRLPPDLKTKVEGAAASNNRSMNAEIVARLEASFDGNTVAFSKEDVDRTMYALARAVLSLVNNRDFSTDQTEVHQQLVLGEFSGSASSPASVASYEAESAEHTSTKK